MQLNPAFDSLTPPEPPAKPPCAEWDIWKGPEVEGSASRGVPTLFIRSLQKFPAIKATDDLSLFRKNSGCTRVWFCHEFVEWAIRTSNWAILRAIAKHFKEVCLEIEPKCMMAIPKRVFQFSRIYLKVQVPFPLKPGDQVCVGQPYEDESFEIGKGLKVSPHSYRMDIKIA